MSTWTLDEPPTHLTWTSVDIWLTTYPPLLVHVVIECPLTIMGRAMNRDFGTITVERNVNAELVERLKRSVMGNF